MKKIFTILYMIITVFAFGQDGRYGTYFTVRDTADQFTIRVPDSSLVYVLDSAKFYLLTDSFSAGDNMNDVFTSGNYVTSISDPDPTATEQLIKDYEWSGNTNTFYGRETGENITSGVGSSFFGDSAGYSISTQDYNTHFGASTAPFSIGSQNSFFGYRSGWQNTTGSNNMFIGYRSGYSNLTGNRSVFIGYEAGFSNTVGDDVMIGFQAGREKATGLRNVFIGFEAGQSTSSGVLSDNVFIGYQAGLPANGVTFSTIIGSYAGLGITTGDNNTLIGYNAGGSLTTQSDNTMMGREAGRLNTGSGNIFIGKEAGENETGSNLLYIDNSNTTDPLIKGNFSTDIVDFNGSILIDPNKTDAAPLSALHVVHNQAARTSIRIDNTNTTLGAKMALDFYDGTLYQGELSFDNNAGLMILNASTSNDTIQIQIDEANQLEITDNWAKFVSDGANAGSGQGTGLIIGDSDENCGITCLNFSHGTPKVINNLGYEYNIIAVNAYGDPTAGTVKRFSDSGGFTRAQAIVMNADGNQSGGNRISFWVGAGAGDLTETMWIKETEVKVNGTFVNASGAIADNDATPDVSAANIFVYAGSANSVVLTDLDNPQPGATYTIIGNSDTYTITINTGGNFKVDGGISAVLGADDIIVFYCVADNNYVEISRTFNQ